MNMNRITNMNRIMNMNMNRNRILIIITIMIIILVFMVLYMQKIAVEHFYAIPTGHERPFVNVYDNDRNQLKIVLLSHPFTRDSSYEQYKQYKKDGFIILGISSYNEFPLITSNKHDVLNNPEEKAWKNYNYMTVVDGWLHCFRDPGKYIKNNNANKKIPKLLLSESDFCNTDVYKPDTKIKKQYDFIYICPKDNDKCDGWVATNKNWELAQKCIKIMCQNYKLKGILVGRKECKLPEDCAALLTTTGFLSQEKLIRAYRESKFILLPNITDASPRILTEAMNCDLPLLVNYNIVGGWKYVDTTSGAFFTNEHDLKKGLEYILTNYQHLTPRKYYTENYGAENSGVKFKKFIMKHYNEKIDLYKTRYITL